MKTFWLHLLDRQEKPAGEREYYNKVLLRIFGVWDTEVKNFRETGN